MEIQTGLFDQIVLQRDSKNQSDARVTGKCSGSGPVQARVTQRGKPVRGFNWASVGRANRGTFECRLRGIPAGGPYDVELRVGGDESLKVSGVLVGDVWLVGGQSNMQGCGRAEQAAKPHPMVKAFYMDDRWAVAKDPIHQLDFAIDYFHNNGVRSAKPARNPSGVGPAVAFGQAMFRHTGVPQGLIACAHGGTSMSQWDPALKKLGGKSLYGATTRRLKKNGGRVAGVIWYQGESDANPDAAPHFTKRMKNLVAAFRRDAGNPKLPFVQVQISRVIIWGGGPTHWNHVQDQQRRLDHLIKNVATVPAIDLALDDGIHIGGADQNRLGKRLAYAMNVLREGARAGKPPIAIRRITTAPDPVSQLATFTVEFDNVVGKLVAGSRPCGLSLGQSTLQANAFDICLKGNRATLRAGAPECNLGNASLHYGYNMDPICNITDEADRSVPVFGPIAVGQPRALSDFVSTIRVSPPLPSAGKLHSMKRLALPNVKWQTVTAINGSFFDVHVDLAKLGSKDSLLYFVSEIECAERMKLKVQLGYDGPVKLFIDGKAVFHDPAGTNPAVQDRAKVPFTASKGRHKIVVALGTNDNKAWGIFLRFERMDVPKSLVAKGPGAYEMPRVVG